MTLTNNGLALNINNKTRLFSEAEVKIALTMFDDKKNKAEEIPTFCAQYNREQEENNETIELSKDPIVNNVVKSFISRSNFGFKKYGTTLEDNNLPSKNWIIHIQEELMDAVNYLEKLKSAV